MYHVALLQNAQTQIVFYEKYKQKELNEIFRKDV